MERVAFYSDERNISWRENTREVHKIQTIANIVYFVSISYNKEYEFVEVQGFVTTCWDNNKSK